MLRGVRAFLLNQYYDTFVYPADLTCKHIQCDLLIKVTQIVLKVMKEMRKLYFMFDKK